MALDFATLAERIYAGPPLTGGNAEPDLVWILRGEPHWAVELVDPRYKPDDGWCEITPQAAHTYKQAIDDGASIRDALLRAQLPPEGPNCPELPPAPDPLPGAIRAPSTSPAPEPEALPVRGRRTDQPEAAPRPPRPPRAPRPPRKPRPPRPPRSPRPPRATRPRRPPRPPRAPRAPREARAPRKRDNKQTLFICAFKQHEDGSLQYGWSQIASEAAYASAASVGLVTVETYEPAACRDTG